MSNHWTIQPFSGQRALPLSIHPLLQLPTYDAFSKRAFRGVLACSVAVSFTSCLLLFRVQFRLQIVMKNCFSSQLSVRRIWNTIRGKVASREREPYPGGGGIKWAYINASMSDHQTLQLVQVQGLFLLSTQSYRRQILNSLNSLILKRALIFE